MTRNIENQIRKSRETLQNPWAYLNGEGQYEALAPERVGASSFIDAAGLLGGLAKGQPFSRRQIEMIVRGLQNSMWQKRVELFGSEDVEPSEILDPVLALKVVGYNVVMHESLGHHAAGKDSFEVAGIMDRDNGEVGISRRFVPAMRNFTAAHELAHVVLHEGSGLHRDRAPDGSAIGSRDPKKRKRISSHRCFSCRRNWFEPHSQNDFSHNASRGPKRLRLH